MAQIELAHNRDLGTQVKCLEQILIQSEVITEILRPAPGLGMPNWYLGAGCIAQTVWNAQHGLDLDSNIRDCDLVYFDSSDTSYEAEDVYVRRARRLFEHVPVPVEIRNQARVHLWYQKHFGYKIRPYDSVEDAINSWPTTATSVAVRYEASGEFVVYAPYGLNDLFGVIARPNKTQITKEIYLQKVERWQRIWHKLTVVPWDQLYRLLRRRTAPALL
jgi:hypothetical protein